MFDITKCPKDENGNLLAQTRDGRPVTIITMMGRTPWPLVGYIDDSPKPHTWGRDGMFCGPTGLRGSLDLVNIPEPKRSGEVWVNIYPGGIAHYVCGTRLEADQAAADTRIACVRVPWTEGEGLEGK